MANIAYLVDRINVLFGGKYCVLDGEDLFYFTVHVKFVHCVPCTICTFCTIDVSVIAFILYLF